MVSVESNRYREIGITNTQRNTNTNQPSTFEYLNSFKTNQHHVKCDKRSTCRELLFTKCLNRKLFRALVLALPRVSS